MANAIIANTFLTFSAIGNREDLADVIYNISPTDTPFQRMVGKSKASAVLHEWQTDSLASAAANAQLEGVDHTEFAAVVATSRVGNRCQISSKDVIVSGTQDAVNKAGRNKEIVYQMKKRSNELRRDMEFVLLNNQAPVTGNSTTARQLRPLNSWITTNDSRGAAPGADGSPTTAAVDGTQRAFTETLLKNNWQAVWTSGGNPDTLMVGPFNKGVVSGFTGGATRMDKSEDKKIVASVEVYVGDFGEIKVVPNRFQRDRDAWLLQSDMWSVAYLRPMHTVDLAKTGDAMKGLIQAEYTLRANNEASSGVIADLTTS